MLRAGWLVIRRYSRRYCRDDNTAATDNTAAITNTAAMTILPPNNTAATNNIPLMIILVLRKC